MSNDYERQILSNLINWYENSPSYYRSQVPSRRRIMRLYDNGETDFPAYDIENHIVREDINQAVLNMAKNGFIEYNWMIGQQNHILSKLWLKFSALSQVYKYLRRQPKNEAVDSILSQLKELRDKTNEDWALRWLDDRIAEISRKRSIGKDLPSDKDDINDLLKSIEFLCIREEIETLERVYSIRCFGDSKRFERSVKKRLARILKIYHIKDDCTDEEALRSVGLVRYPELFEFAGALSITFPTGKLDFSCLASGGTLNIDDINQGVISIDECIQRVLSIENRANYIEYVRKCRGKNELVLFHGGQFSPAKRVFLDRIVSSMPSECDFYHWGDIDYGGFIMLARLRREIFPGIKQWRMDEHEIIRFEEFSVGYPEAYGKRLASLLEIPELNDCTPCIEFMLMLRKRLEQESMLI